MRVQRIKRNADLLVGIVASITDIELSRLRQQIKERFSGHRAMIFRKDDVEITSLARPRLRPYRPSMLAHGGRAGR